MITPQMVQILSRSRLWAIQADAVVQAVLLATHGATGWEASKPSLKGRPGNKTAHIPIEGVLSKDGPAWYGSNYNTISNALEQATADPDVKHIVLSVDSPGGEVVGLPETAALIAQAAQAKPVTAVVEGMSASAAYYLASQARDVISTPSGQIGSVGVRMMHADMSKMLDNAGVKITELFSGDFKTEWSPYTPLSDAAKEDMQPRLAAMHQQFIDAVSAGRGTRASADIQTARYGEGRMFSASAAAANGMIDRVQSPREFYASLAPVKEEPNAVSLPLRARFGVDAAKINPNLLKFAKVITS